MEKVVKLDEFQALTSSIGVLKSYLAYNKIPLDSVEKGFLNSVQNELIGFYQTDDTNLKFAYLKAISTALTKTVYDCPDIPQEKKNAVAHIMTSQLCESLLASKEYYDLQMRQGVYKDFAYNDPTANKLYSDNVDKYRIVRKTTFLKKATQIGKSYIKRIGMSYAVFGKCMDPASAAIATTVWVIGSALVPESIKSKIKGYADDLKQRAEKSVKRMITIGEQYLENTTWGPAVIDVAHKVVTKVKDFSAEVKSKVSELKSKVSDKISQWRRNIAVFFS